MNSEFQMKNETIITADERIDLNKVLFKAKFIPLIITYEIVICCFLIYSILVKNVLLIWMSSIVLVLLPVGTLLANYFTNKKASKKFAIEPKIHFNFIFKNEKFEVSVNDGKANNTMEIPYKNLYQVLVSEKNIFLFISSGSAYVVSKLGFENYDYLAFESLVKPNIKKYKVIK